MLDKAVVIGKGESGPQTRDGDSRSLACANGKVPCFLAPHPEDGGSIHCQRHHKSKIIKDLVASAGTGELRLVNTDFDTRKDIYAGEYVLRTTPRPISLINSPRIVVCPQPSRSRWQLIILYLECCGRRGVHSK
jgi:hypothetical protein